MVTTPAEADAHAAPARHEDAGFLAGIQDRGATIGLNGEVAGEEGDLAPLARLDDGGAEPLGVQPLGNPGVGPVRLGRVEQAGRAAGPGVALAPVGHQGAEPGQVEHAVLVVEVDRQREAAVGGVRLQLAREDDIRRRGRAVHLRDVGKLLEGVAQHAHDPA